MKGTIFIRADGLVETIGDPCIQLEGREESERASEILPDAEGKRALFIILRLIFGDNGRVAEFTRKWKGPWRATIYATGERRVFETREHAVEWEVGVLNEILSK